MSFRDYLHRGSESALSCKVSSRQRRSDGTSKDPTPNFQIGVRPRLDMRCPVTLKPLKFDDNDSFSGQPSMLSSSDDSVVSDQENERGLAQIIFRSTQQKTPFCKPKTYYSQLSSEIVNFQKLVSDLEQVMKRLSQTPESQWRCKILIRSAGDADRDIQRQFFVNLRGNQNMAYRKLYRDYRRAQVTFQRILDAHERQQRANISYMFSREQTKEDFFDRAMREREQEHNAVNGIYKDIAGLVDSQQETLDRISEIMDSSGFDKIQESSWGLCGGSVPTQPASKADVPRLRPKLRVDEDFNWSMPFETITEDMRDVQQDIIKVMEDLQENYLDTKYPLSCCSARITSDAMETNVRTKERTRRTSHYMLRELNNNDTLNGYDF